jgi:hypothetical protein
VFSSTRAKWLSIVLLILIGASISGSLFANESHFFHIKSQADSFAYFISLETSLWILGSALLGLAGIRRFNCDQFPAE